MCFIRRLSVRRPCADTGWTWRTPTVCRPLLAASLRSKPAAIVPHKGACRQPLSNLQRGACLQPLLSREQAPHALPPQLPPAAFLGAAIQVGKVCKVVRQLFESLLEE